MLVYAKRHGWTGGTGGVSDAKPSEEIKEECPVCKDLRIVGLLAIPCPLCGDDKS